MPSQPTCLIVPRWSFLNAAADPVVNVFAFSKIGSTDPFDNEGLGLAIAEVGNAYSDTVGQAISEDLRCDSVLAVEVSSGPGFSLEIEPPEGTWLNVDDGAATPPWQCAVVSHSTTAPGRSGRGRTFMPGIRATFVDSSGTVNSLIRTELATQFAAWRDAISGTGPEQPLQAVVYSRKNDTVASILGSVVRPLVGIQRDRRAGSN